MKHFVLTLSAATFLAAAPGPAPAQEVNRELVPVTGDVFLMRNNFHNSLVVRPSEGTVRIDPINAEAGAWLNDNLGSIDAPPVSHLIYSHSHLDHASGGDAHAGAEVIMHEDAPEAVDGVAATRRVGDSESIEIGGKTFEMTNLGPGHDNHMLVTVVRPENVAFIVDVAAPKRLPFRDFAGANLDDWIGQIAKAQELDFEIFAPGHASPGTPEDLDDAMTYMQDLRAGVLAGLQAGKSVDEITADLTLDAYGDWGQYEDWRPLNIQGMADYLQREGLVN